MSDPIHIIYSFQFKKGKPVEIDLHLDPESLECKGWRTVSAPSWVNLDFEQCSNCLLEAAQNAVEKSAA